MLEKYADYISDFAFIVLKKLCAAMINEYWRHKNSFLMKSEQIFWRNSMDLNRFNRNFINTGRVSFLLGTVLSLYNNCVKTSI